MTSKAVWLRNMGRLRTFLNDIISCSEVISSEKFGPVANKYRELAQEIGGSARRILDNPITQSPDTDQRKIKSMEEPLNVRFISFSIRIPLIVILHFSDVIKGEMFGPIDSRYRTYAEDVHVKGMLLLDFINGMLDLLKLEAGKLERNEQSVDVEEVVQEAFRIVVPQAMQGEVTLRWVPSKTKLPNLYCDRVHLRWMLLNMLSNAFDKPRQLVEVGTDLSKGLAIVLSNTGSDVLKDSLKSILTKSLIEQYGGQLSIVSTRNDGVTARLSFPPERIIRSVG
ncbi:MAG TPA: HAMP domain-containing sensor histidine kinase [Bradyrhizobium sp.]|nr:HAMP domain-containing sensor histidine kinase [Bradyrhizobium sp.]